jgi:hypothetical protein
VSQSGKERYKTFQRVLRILPNLVLRSVEWSMANSASGVGSLARLGKHRQLQA